MKKKNKMEGTEKDGKLKLKSKKETQNKRTEKEKRESKNHEKT